jgi:hypothetical protein
MKGFYKVIKMLTNHHKTEAYQCVARGRHQGFSVAMAQLGIA